MSVQAIAWVLDRSNARGLDRLVLIVLANHHNGKDGRCDPGQRLIAREARIGVGTVSACLKRLQALGELGIRKEGDARRSTKYYLPFMEPEAEESARLPSAARGPEVSAARGPEVSRTGTNRKEPDSEGEPPSAPPARAPRRRSPRDDLFDALVAAFGDASTPSRGSFYGQTVSELVAAGATPEQVARAAAEMRRRGWEKPSPKAMLQHWDDLLRAPTTGNPAAARFWEEGQ